MIIKNVKINAYYIEKIINKYFKQYVEAEMENKDFKAYKKIKKYIKK